MQPTPDGTLDIDHAILTWNSIAKGDYTIENAPLSSFTIATLGQPRVTFTQWADVKAWLEARQTGITLDGWRHVSLPAPLDRDLLKALLIQIRMYSVQGRKNPGDCVAWHTLQRLIGVGGNFAYDNAWLHTYLTEHPHSPADTGPYWGHKSPSAAPLCPQCGHDLLQQDAASVNCYNCGYMGPAQPEGR